MLWLATALLWGPPSAATEVLDLTFGCIQDGAFDRNCDAVPDCLAMDSTGAMRALDADCDGLADCNDGMDNDCDTFNNHADIRPNPWHTSVDCPGDINNDCDEDGLANHEDFYPLVPDTHIPDAVCVETGPPWMIDPEFNGVHNWLTALVNSSNVLCEGAGCAPPLPPEKVCRPVDVPCMVVARIDEYGRIDPSSWQVVARNVDAFADTSTADLGRFIGAGNGPEWLFSNAAPAGFDTFAIYAKIDEARCGDTEYHPIFAPCDATRCLDAMINCNLTGHDIFGTTTPGTGGYVAAKRVFTEGGCTNKQCRYVYPAADLFNLAAPGPENLFWIGDMVRARFAGSPDGSMVQQGDKLDYCGFEARQVWEVESALCGGGTCPPATEMSFKGEHGECHTKMQVFSWDEPGGTPGEDKLVMTQLNYDELGVYRWKKSTGAYATVMRLVAPPGTFIETPEYFVDDGQSYLIFGLADSNSVATVFIAKVIPHTDPLNPPEEPFLQRVAAKDVRHYEGEALVRPRPSGVGEYTTLYTFSWDPGSSPLTATTEVCTPSVGVAGWLE